MAIVALEGIRIFGYHGLYPEEQVNGNHFQVDVYVDTGKRPLAQNDRIEETVDYAVIYQIVNEEMGIRANLLETLLGRVGSRILSEIDGFDAVRVRVSKEHPPVEGECKRSYVEEVFVKTQLDEAS